jgi:hypothetical protein
MRNLFPRYFQAREAHSISEEADKTTAAWFQRDNILNHAWRWTTQGQVREGFTQPKQKLESDGDSIDLWTPDPQ